MDKKIIIANWKSHKNTKQAEEFISEFSKNINRINLDNKDIIIAPPFQLLDICKRLIEKYNLPIKLSAQNISSFGEGAFTGEINGSQIKDLADYTIIGHSERRNNFGEDDTQLVQKVKEAEKANLEAIFCIQKSTQKIPSGADMVAYEPPSAIGSGMPDSPIHIEKVFSEIEEKYKGKILYGGSVDEKNVRDFIYIEHCSGLLVGGASLEADNFSLLLSQW